MTTSATSQQKEKKLFREFSIKKHSALIILEIPLIIKKCYNGAMVLIVGLGNPGRQFKNTPHNLGFDLVDRLRKNHRLPRFRREGRALVSRGTIAGQSIILVKPTTFMNDSGQAVSFLMKKYGLDPDRIWLVHDDINLELGTIKMTRSRGAGGHKGVSSVIERLGGNQFPRIRLGASLREKTSLKQFVLEPYRRDQKSVAREMIKRASETMIELIEKTGPEKAGFALEAICKPPEHF